MDAASILKITAAVISFASPLLPAIIQLFQQAHPIPVDATQPVKDDLNALKAAGALQAVSVLVNQAAAAGKVPIPATDPIAQAALAGAVEQTYQTMKAAGQLNSAPPAPGTHRWLITVARV